MTRTDCVTRGNVDASHTMGNHTAKIALAGCPRRIRTSLCRFRTDLLASFSRRSEMSGVASGCVSTHATQAVDTLADYSNAAFELLELALDEAAKERADQALVDSFSFLFGQALERLRLDIEASYETASDIAERVRKRLVTASQPGASDPSTILFLVQSGAAKLDLGEELSGAVEHLIEEVGAANARANGPVDLFGLVADLVKQVNGDAFTLFSC